MARRNILAVLLAAFAFATVTFWPAPAPASAKPPASANISCQVQWVHDGDTMRCAGYRKSSRLYGIDAPEMPGACRQGRECVSGDPYAARDYLASLVARGPVRCQHTETDRYQRPIMQCWVGKVNLSCAMIAAGHAVRRYGRLRCR
jgi:endonuclease YncB( thermonuclease family)